MKRPYLLKLRGGIWYYKLPGDTAYHSTGEKKNKRAIAEMRILETLRAPAPAAPPSCPTLEAFAADFYAWGKCQWIARQHAKGRKCSKAYADGRRGHLQKWILPKWGKTPMDQLRRPQLETWAISLPLANWTRTIILYSLRVILREAVDQGIIERNPLERIEPFGGGYRKRDILSNDELRLLFPVSGMEAIWGGRREACMFLLTLTAGLRAGEVRAAQWRQILFADNAMIVDRAIKGKGDDEVFGGTKTGEVRVIPLPNRTVREMKALREADAEAGQDALIFPGSSPIGAVPRNWMGRRLDIALKNASISTEGRNIVVHSLRHTYNTMVRRRVPEEALRALMGHSSIAMSDRYDHPQIAERLEALAGTREFIGGLLG